MKAQLPRIFGDDSDQSWEWYGAHDPYYGVLTVNQYRAANWSPEAHRLFFDTGFAHVDRVLTAAAKHFGFSATGSCLDFGCGVGRLAIPFAKKFERVVGVDVSPSMRFEAKKNCELFGTTNVDLASSIHAVAGRFDLVHTYIVLQHISTSRGRALMEQLIDKTRSCGVCFLHFTIGRKSNPFRDLGTIIRRNIKPAHVILNILERKPAREAFMQINDYNLSELIQYLYDRDIRNVWLESENHDGRYSVCLMFKVP